MRIKKKYKIYFSLLIIICVLVIGCMGLYFGITSYFAGQNKINKVNLTDDIIINNLNNNDISDLVGNEPILKEDDAEIKSEEVPVPNTELKEELSTEQNAVINDSETNIKENSGFSKE